MASDMSGRLLPHTAKPPVNLSLNNEPSGCTIIDVTFGNTLNVEIEEIKFRNHYTSFLSIKWCPKSSIMDTGRPPRWSTCIRNLQLMPDPRSEDGGQDTFVIPRHMFQSEVCNVGVLRFILQQPCATWREFSLEALEFHKRVDGDASGNTRGDSGVSSALKYLSSVGETARVDELGCPLSDGAVEHLSTLMQSAVTLIGRYREMLLPTNRSQIGRFDKDGVYDIHVLSSNP